MLKAVKGNKLCEISEAKLIKTAQQYQQTEIDLGTGDGRFVFKSAVMAPQTFFIGIDPNQKQLETYAKKAAKKHLQNILFVLDSVENLQWDVKELAQRIYVILPWGSLLQTIVTPNAYNLVKLRELLKPKGVITIILGYSQEIEPNEMQRLQLQNLTIEYLEKVLTPEYQKVGLLVTNIQEITRADLKKFETSWSKKLSFGKDRQIFLLEILKN